MTAGAAVGNWREDLSSPEDMAVVMRIAHHEAAHFVVHLATDNPRDPWVRLWVKTGLSPEGDRHGYWVGGFYKDYGEYPAVVHGWHALAGDCSDQIFSGCSDADEWLRSHPIEKASDYPNIRRAFGADPEVHRRERRHVMRLVRKHWPLVERIAAALFKAEAMIEEDLRAVVGSYEFGALPLALRLRLARSGDEEWARSMRPGFL